MMWFQIAFDVIAGGLLIIACIDIILHEKHLNEVIDAVSELEDEQERRYGQ